MNNLGVRLAAKSPCLWSKSVPPHASSRLARNLHRRHPLPYPVEHGVGDFLPPVALKVVAVDYQEGLLDRLNDEVRGTELENKTVAQTVISTAADRTRTLAYNYASQALNNSFFLDSVKPPENDASKPSHNHEAQISTGLASAIYRQHGGLDQLKSNFSAAALGLIGSGWIWFVTDGLGHTAVLPTFGAGTLLIRSRRQTAVIPGEEDPTSLPPLVPSTPTRSLYSTLSSPSDSLLTSTPRGLNLSGSHSIPASANVVDEIDTATDEEKIYGLAKTLHPLFCVSVHEHAWMSAKYGVWGKEEYMRRFWSVVDWHKASRRFQHFVERKNPSSYTQTGL